MMFDRETYKALASALILSNRADAGDAHAVANSVAQAERLCAALFDGGLTTAKNAEALTAGTRRSVGPFAPSKHNTVAVEGSETPGES